MLAEEGGSLKPAGACFCLCIFVLKLPGVDGLMINYLGGVASLYTPGLGFLVHLAGLVFSVSHLFIDTRSSLKGLLLVFSTASEKRTALEIRNHKGENHVV